MVRLKNVNIELSCDPPIPLLGIYPNELKAESQTDICTPMIVTVLFTIVKRWKQSKCQSMAKRINKMCYACGQKSGAEINHEFLTGQVMVGIHAPGL